MQARIGGGELDQDPADAEKVIEAPDQGHGAQDMTMEEAHLTVLGAGVVVVAGILPVIDVEPVVGGGLQDHRLVPHVHVDFRHAAAGKLALFLIQDLKLVLRRLLLK